MKQHKINGSGKVFDKTKAEEGAFFVKMPSDLMNYVHVPGYKPEYSYLYTIIVDYYNADYGYAFPTEWQISRYYGKGVKTVRNHLKKLEDFGLIKIQKPRRNNVYIPFKPLSQEELFRVCPEARQNYSKTFQDEAAEYEREARNKQK